jgi:hypothetical protein
MQYKTIVIGLLEQRHPLHSMLRKRRMLLPAMQAYALELKDCHKVWKYRLSQAKPDNDQSQIASEALELAIHDLECYLPPASPLDDSEALSLDEAMAFIRRRMPPG